MVPSGLLRGSVVLGHPAGAISPPQCTMVESRSPRCLQIGDQGGRGLVGLSAAGGEIGLDALVVVPDLSVHKQLNEAYAAFHEPAGDEAAGSVFAGDGIVESVKPPGCLGFPGEVERLLGGRLHARREFITGDDALRSASRDDDLNVPIQAGQQRQVLFLRSAFQSRGWVQVEDPRFGGRTTVPWNSGGMNPLDQFRTPSTG